MNQNSPQQTWTSHSLDRWIGFEVSKVTHPDMPQLELDRKGLNELFLITQATMFEFELVDMRYLFNFMRHADSAKINYEAARRDLLAFSANHRALGSLFGAFRHLEQGLAAFNHAQAHFREMVGTTDDLHPVLRNLLARARAIYNVSKHMEEGADPEKREARLEAQRAGKQKQVAAAWPAGGTMGWWISNDGIHTTEAHVSYRDLCELIGSIHEVAYRAATGQLWLAGKPPVPSGFADSPPAAPAKPIVPPAVGSGAGDGDGSHCHQPGIASS